MMFKAISMGMVFTMLFTTTTEVFATDNNLQDQKAANIIEQVTGIDDVNTDTYETDTYAAVADGKEVVVEVPKSGNESVRISDSESVQNDVTMNLPEEIADERATVTDNGTIVYSSKENSVTVGVQPLAEEVEGVSLEGVRTTITINDASASKEYSFKYDLPEGSKLITAKEFLGDEFDTGEVYVINSDNEITSIIDAAWAKDANGEDIVTYYKVNGNMLTQVVEFDENTAFPVVADPSLWKIAKCTGAILWVVGSTCFAAAKIVKIKRYVKSIGGVKRAATLLMRAGRNASKAKLLEIGGSSLMNLASEILGITTVKDNCF